MSQAASASPSTLRFLPVDLQVEFDEREELSILELAQANNIELSHSCGGMGACTTCRIFLQVNDRELPPRNELENERAQERKFRPDERLACQVRAEDGFNVTVPQSK